MLNNLNTINKAIEDTLVKHGFTVKVTLEFSRYPDRSDIQCNELLKYKDYKDISKLIEEIKINLEELKEVEACTIGDDRFINIVLSNKFLEKELAKNKEDFINNLKTSKKKKVLIDYGGPNIGKALHVGHLRSLSIGRSIYNMHTLIGDNVVSDIHLGDWGMPVAYIIALIEKEGIKNYDKDYSKLEEIYPRATELADKDKEFYKKAKNIALDLNNNKKGYLEIWNKMLFISKDYIKEVLDRLGHKFDKWDGESTVNSFIEPMLKRLKEDGKLVLNDGALVANIDTDPPILITKSDNSYLYITTDLATAIERNKDSYDHIVYVVDSRQKKHFEQLFQCVDYFEISDAKFEHVGFGTINGLDGKPLKTRDGDVYKLDQLYLDIESKLSENKTPKKVIGTLVNSILTYSDLITNRATDYKFDIDKFTETTGKTAIYIHYSSVRAKNILRKNTEEYSLKNFIISNIIERDLVITILKFKYFLDLALTQHEPHYIAEYAYELSSKFNSFYEDEVIINLSGNEKKSKLFLTKSVLDVLGTAMFCLGLEEIDEL